MKRVLNKKHLGLGAVLFFALLMSSCVNYKNILLFQEKSLKGTTEFTSQTGSPYKLKPGDHLYIKIYSVDPKTSKFFQTDFPQFMSSTYLYLNSYKVNEEGYLSFSFIEKMYVKGLTIEEVKDVIQNTLDQYFKESTVYVKLVNFQITMLGEVNGKGTKDVNKEAITMYEAIGLAGGFTEYADVKHVKLIRQTPNGSKIIKLDLTDNAFLQSEYLHLQPNDIIYVDPRITKPFVFRRYPYGFAIGTIVSTLAFLALFDVDIKL